MANPLGSLTVSAEPDSPPTVEKRMAIGVFLPIFSNTQAFEYFLMSWVTSKWPKAPEPFACTTRSGMRSRSKAAISSSSTVSCNSIGPRGPAVSEAYRLEKEIRSVEQTLILVGFKRTEFIANRSSKRSRQSIRSLKKNKKIHPYRVFEDFNNRRYLFAARIVFELWGGRVSLLSHLECFEAESKINLKSNQALRIGYLNENSFAFFSFGDRNENLKLSNEQVLVLKISCDWCLCELRNFDCCSWPPWYHCI